MDILGQDSTGALPHDPIHLLRLKWLSLSFNDFVGTIPKQCGALPDLKISEVTENRLTGPVPAGTFEKANLLQLNLACDVITGTPPSTLVPMTSLHSVFFFNALLTSTLPTETGQLSSLRNLWLHENTGLGGPTPSEIGNLSLLEELKPSHDSQSGPLSSEIWQLDNLEEFLFAHNKMNGATTPEECWSASSPVFLDVNSAGFGGTLSAIIGKVSTLKGIKTSGNQFVGTPPTELGLLDNSLSLWVHMNPALTGSVPAEVCQLHWHEDLMCMNADCSGACLRVKCSSGCCTECCNEFDSCQSAQRCSLPMKAVCVSWCMTSHHEDHTCWGCHPFHFCVKAFL